jgi:cell filamentation protein
MPYDVDKDPYLDKNTGVLRNLLGITTQDALDDAEAQVTYVESVALTTNNSLRPDQFNASLLKSIHRQLFKSIYDWAGELRTVELSKGVTSFARFQYLEANLDDLFKQLTKEEYLVNLDFDTFIERFASYYGDLIVLHPFREGNGRAIRTLLAMHAEVAGWHTAWDKMTPEENVAASIATYQGNETPMVDMIRKLITPLYLVT